TLVTGGTPPFTFTTTTVQQRVGATWQPIGTTAGFVNAMASHNGQLASGGQCTLIGGLGASGVAGRSGRAWSALRAGVHGDVRALASFNGALWAGGFISSAGSVATGNLAIWNGSAWSAGPSFNNDVNALAVRSGIALGQSYLYVGGAF